jgi:hypothetical protein
MNVIQMEVLIFGWICLKGKEYPHRLEEEALSSKALNAGG